MGFILAGMMIYRFGAFELDLAAAELRADGIARSLEPQVFRLLALLIENHGRLVSKDEIIEKVWDGRVISDAAVASRVKSARQALGDDGQRQQFIKTIHRRGFRFIGDIRVLRGAAPHLPSDTYDPDVSQSVGVLVRQLERMSRPSIAVLPFRIIGDDVRCKALASALPDELITELSRLRWLFVTARGSSFRVHTENASFGEIGQLLGVRYCLWGTLEISRPRLVVTVELVDTCDEGIVWADRFSGRVDDVHSIREDIRARALMALDLRIPMHEAALARLAVSDDLDAWSAYHLGLQHIYRFNRRDNAAASQLFQRAVTLDPGFARAHAGLSFVHFQAAFMRYTEDIAGEVRAGRRAAERGVELDALDPFVNFTMGRTYWLEGDLDGSLSWLERATRISPNYAQGIYARAWTETLAGYSSEGRKHVDLAMRLSPIDPLYYAMMGTRAFTHMLAGEDTEAADWAERAAHSPGAHVLIAMIAAAAQSLKGDAARAAWWAANVRERNPAMRRNDFFRAFPMRSDSTRLRVLEALRQLGF
ncbi:MAG TPA: winged helix-turn-helix domain-containing protein [Steroidobacteraceae bacterium]|nr:winged helix-turn-helix domain-containing protein [Steroidobacteraceae bacterium]